MNRVFLIGTGIAGFGVAAYALLRPLTAEAADSEEYVNPNPVPKSTSPKLLYLNNPGNMRFVPSAAKRFDGMMPTAVNGFAQFSTIEKGVRAIYQQFLIYQKRGLRTPAKMIAVWAPRSENPTESYAAFMAKAVGLPTAETEFDLSKYRVAWTQAIIRFEQGKSGLFTNAEVDQWTKN